MKVLIFGTGNYYEQYSAIIYEQDEVVGLLDNNPDKWGSTIDGVKVYSPNGFSHMQYDKIILLSVHDIEMYKQLVDNGIPYNKVMYWKEYYARIIPSAYTFINEQKPLTDKKSVLIITTNLSYNGGSLAAVYAANALSMRGYYVVIAAPDANADFLREHADKGMGFIIYPKLPYVDGESLSFVQTFDVVIVNVFQMIQCACVISRIKPTMWWIHEPGETYESIYSETLCRFHQYAVGDDFRKMSIYAVSDIARRNFHAFFPKASVGLLPYGIPDENHHIAGQEEGKLIFAVVGYIHERKGQDIFIDAIRSMKEYKEGGAEYWLIGKNLENDFGNRIRAAAFKEPTIKIWGEMTREKMRDLYKEIDIIVCPSREETMSIVVTEGMMYGKPCIVSDNTGMADYITDGENGIICKAGDSMDLRLKMRWCMEHRNQLQTLGRNARTTYEKFFSLEKFGDRLHEELMYISHL